MKVVLFRINVFILIILCIAVFGYVIVSAQENVRRVEKTDAVLTIDGDVMVEGPQDGGPQKTQIFLKSEDGKTLIIDANDGKRVNKRSEKQGTSEVKSLQRSPGMMQKEGLSPEKMRDIEANKKMRAQNIGKEQAGTPIQGGSPQPQQNQPQGQVPPDSGVQRYLNIILNKNLFMPLGSSRKEQKPSYVLTGVISDDSGKSNSKAIIEQAGGQKSYFLSPGETVEGDTKVTEIDEWQVKMNRSGEQMTLKLGEGTRSGAMQGFRGGGGEGQRGSSVGRKGESRTDKSAGVSGGDNFNPNDIPPFVKQMLEQQGISIEDLKNNPDLREKLKQQFQQKFGDGGSSGIQGRRGG
ncbi:MAG: hypothetical protein QG588_131 [Candidatus Poribacteria bacterium]|nr:hypothetical protein [Candidatus Poribacteria bacterium]